MSTVSETVDYCIYQQHCFVLKNAFLPFCHFGAGWLKTAKSKLVSAIIKKKSHSKNKLLKVATLPQNQSSFGRTEQL